MSEKVLQDSTHFLENNVNGPPGPAPFVIHSSNFRGLNPQLKYSVFLVVDLIPRNWKNTEHGTTTNLKKIPALPIIS